MSTEEKKGYMIPSQPQRPESTNPSAEEGLDPKASAQESEHDNNTITGMGEDATQAQEQVAPEVGYGQSTPTPEATETISVPKSSWEKRKGKIKTGIAVAVAGALGLAGGAFAVSKAAPDEKPQRPPAATAEPSLPTASESADPTPTPETSPSAAINESDEFPVIDMSKPYTYFSAELGPETQPEEVVDAAWKRVIQNSINNDSSEIIEGGVLPENNFSKVRVLTPLQNNFTYWRGRLNSSPNSRYVMQIDKFKLVEASREARYARYDIEWTDREYDLNMKQFLTSVTIPERENRARVLFNLADISEYNPATGEQKIKRQWVIGDVSPDPIHGGALYPEHANINQPVTS